VLIGQKSGFQNRAAKQKGRSVCMAHLTVVKWTDKKISEKGLTNIMIYAILTVRIS
jgi:hypothetical protein